MIARLHLLGMGAVAAAGFAIGAAFYPKLPNPCPTHWDISGQPDGYGSPLQMALLFPSIVTGTGLMLVVLPLLGPFRRNLEEFRLTYGRICIFVMLVLVGMQVIFLLKAGGAAFRLGPAVAILVGLIIAVLGNWMGKIRRNFYMGIRTPWTLANEVVWEKTHRAGGRVFVAAGLASALGGLLLPDPACYFVVIGTVGAAALWCAGYSYYVYRRLGQVDDLP
jgi:uncharacterized membrane protein